jgi:hypothetical protein
VPPFSRTSRKKNKSSGTLVTLHDTASKSPFSTKPLLLFNKSLFSILLLDATLLNKARE